MMAFELTRQIAELFIMIFLGIILVKSNLLKQNDSKVLSTVVLYIVNPCVIINAFQIDYSEDIKNGLILSFGMAIVIHIVYIAFTKIIGKLFSLDGVERATIIYTNAGNLVIPLVQALLGEEWVIYTTAYIMVQTILIWTHGRMLICEEKGFHLKSILKNVNVIASILGVFMFIFRIQFPSLITETMASLSAMVAPLSMLVAGMLIGGMDVKACLKNRRLYGITFVKMILFPAAAVFLLKYVGLKTAIENAESILLITLLASVAPTAASVTQLAQIYDGNSEYASAYYFITTFFCIVSMPLFVWLYQF